MIRLVKKKLRISLAIISIVMVNGCQGGGQINSLPTSDTCSDTPQGKLDAKDVKNITLSTQPIKESNNIRAGENIGYAFDAKPGDKLSWQTKDNLCVWVFSPSNQLVKGVNLSEKGKHTIQVSVPKGTTTFTLEMGLGNIVPPVASTQSPPNNNIATSANLNEDQAKSIVQNWLNSKGRIFGPPFDRQLVTQLTTGKRYTQIMQPGGSIDWLVENRSYYTYSISNVDRVWSFDNSKNLVEIKVRVTEDLSLHNSSGGIDPERSGRTTANFIYYLSQDNGSWKIYDSRKTED